MTFEKSETHAHRGLLKFAAPFWGKPRWAALFVAIARQIQELENALWDVLEKRTLDNATGAQLRVLGALVGQLDPGLGEPVFKTLIRVRIRINRSEGRYDDLIEVLQLLSIPVAQRSVTPSYPAKYLVNFTGALPLPIDLLTKILNDTVAGGVGVVVTYGATTGGFHFSNDTATSTGNDRWANESTSGDPWVAVYQ